MWPFTSKPRPEREDVERLIQVLTQCRNMVADSHDSLFSGDNEEQIGGVLDQAIKALKSGKGPNHRKLTELFRPTGALQETAQDNGWDREYLTLAREFARLIKRVR
jgi:hypothetical protein